MLDGIFILAVQCILPPQKSRNFCNNLHPRPAMWWAVPAPMPELAPVISTTFPLRLPAVAMTIR